MNFDRSVNAMWYYQECKIATACFDYLDSLIPGHIVIITTVECVLVHSIIFSLASHMQNVAGVSSSVVVNFNVKLNLRLYIHGNNKEV